MTDIVERLRMPTAYGDRQRKEAADEIGRLRAALVYISEHGNNIAKAMTDIVERLRHYATLVGAPSEVAAEAAAEIERLRDDYSILKQDYDALRADNERLRTTLGYLADNISDPALVAVAETALKAKS